MDDWVKLGGGVRNLSSWYLLWRYSLTLYWPRSCLSLNSTRGGWSRSLVWLVG